MPALPIEEYEVGWICALPKELTAARAMLDEKHEEYKSQSSHDNNSYVLGRIHDHNVVLACLPAGVYGTVSAATVAVNMLRTFTGIRFGLMVGIGGGIPNLSKGVDVRLGDVVVSQPDKTHGGVVQFDLRKNLGEGVFEQKGVLRPPPTLLLAALANLQSLQPIEGNQISKTLTAMVERLPQLAKLGYIHPGPDKDVLYCSNVECHKETRPCLQCQNDIVQRQAREKSSPEIHYGVIASGNELMKNVVERDRLGREFGAKCVEMEAAGLMNEFPCLVIRGICDYADSHKNDIWQEYAAVTSAAFAKELLSIVKPSEVKSVTRAAEITKYSLGLNLFDAPDLDDDLFIGRQTEIQEMELVLQPDSDSFGTSRKVLIVGGMGGIGKTQLTITYAKRYRTSYSSVFWLNAASEVTLTVSFRNLANRVLPPEMVSKLDDNQMLIYSFNWLSEPQNHRWLLVFDNHDDSSQYDVTKFYPSVAHGSIIITTRTPDDLPGAQIKIQHMTEDEDSLRILATRSGRRNIYFDSGSRPLTRRLDGFPLALATAGAYLKQTPIDCTTYLQRYEEVWQVSRTKVSQLPEYPSRTLYTTWTLSLTQIEKEMPQAAELLRFLAYVDHQDIWYELLCVDDEADQPLWYRELIRDKFTFIEAMVVLTRYCLVETHHDAQSYSLHTCVHDWTLDGLNREIEWNRYWLAFDCVAHQIEDEYWDDLSQIRYRRFVSHAKRLLHNRFQPAAKQHESLQIRLEQTENLAQLLQEQMQYDVAEEMYLRALAGKEQALGAEHTSTLQTVNNLGNLYRNQGKLAEAEEYYLRALVGNEQALGAEHVSTLQTVNNLGNLYRNQGKLAEAEEMYLRALAGKEQTLGTEHTSTLQTVGNLGVLYWNQGKLAEAEEMYLRALAGKEQTLGTEHTSTLDTVGNLGVLYRNQGKLAEAEEMYLRALAGKEQTLGTEHTSTLDTVGNLGILYWNQGKLAEAEEYYLRALAGYEKASQSKTLPALSVVYNIALHYRDQGKMEEARKMFERARSGYEKVLGYDHSETLDVIDQLKELPTPVEAKAEEVQDTRQGFHTTKEERSLEKLADMEECESRPSWWRQ